jgi:hypothetical protein
MGGAARPIIVGSGGEGPPSGLVEVRLALVEAKLLQSEEAEAVPGRRRGVLRSRHEGADAAVAARRLELELM